MNSAPTAGTTAIRAADPRLTHLVDARRRGVEIAEQFEQIFVEQMVSNLRDTVDINGDGEGLFAQGPGSDTYTMWFDRLLGEKVQSESQIGVADSIVRQLEKHREIPRLEEITDRIEAARRALPAMPLGRLQDVMA